MILDTYENENDNLITLSKAGYGRYMPHILILVIRVGVKYS